VGQPVATSVMCSEWLLVDYLRGTLAILLMNFVCPFRAESYTAARNECSTSYPAQFVLNGMAGSVGHPRTTRFQACYAFCVNFRRLHCDDLYVPYRYTPVLWNSREACMHTDFRCCVRIHIHNTNLLIVHKQ
jgi:hypothetical protein